MKTIRLFEAFAGLGSQRIALNELAKNKNWKVESVGIIEWYVDAIIAYECLHNPKAKVSTEDVVNTKHHLSANSKKPIKNIHVYDNKKIAGFINNSEKLSNNLFNISEVKGVEIPKNIDIFTYSFPCQDLSIQGKQKGMNFDSKTRSGLVWEVLRIIGEMKKCYQLSEMPKYFVLENVKSIRNFNHYPQYKLFVSKLESLGYKTKEVLLDSSKFGSAQKRERFFAVSARNDLPDFNFNLAPIFKNKPKTLNKIIDYQNIVPVSELILKLANKKRTSWNKSASNIIKSTIIDYTNFNSEAYVYHHSGIGPTLTASGANSRIKVLDKNENLRCLTAKECIRYMGMDDKHYKKLKQENLLSDAKIIFLSGNSISIELLKVVFNSFHF